MKRILTLALALLLCLLLAAPALADVIYEPEDDFYKNHRDECSYEARNYIVTASGAEICSRPGGKTIGSWAPGETIHADYLYTDPQTGDVWGSCMFRDGNNWKEGWVCLTGMQIVYDYRDFAAEYGAKFYGTDGGVCLCDTAVVEWAYPGAPEPVRIIEKEDRPDADENVRGELTLYLGTTRFDDENGNQWGFLGYWRGRRNTWVCLSDPDAEVLPVREITPHYVEKAAASEQKAAGNLLPWVAGGVVVLAAGSAGTLLGIRKKQGKRTEEKR